MRGAVFAAKIALGLLLLAGGRLHAEDWPMDGRDLHHSFSNHQFGINPDNVAKLQSPDDSQMETPFQMETPLSRTYILEILGVAAILYLIGSLRVLRQYERGVVFLLGKFEGVRGPGLTLIFLPIQQMVRVSLRTVTMQIPSQKIITKDNVSIDIAAVAYYHISDPEKAVIVIENVYNAINQISQTTVRNVVGRFSLDQLLSDTAGINLQIKNVIDGHTEPWGTKVTAVEIKDIVLPDNMQRAMAKEAEAERERRAKIVAAEGEYQAAVKLGQAADIITEHPVALQLRTLQTMAEISVEKNSTIIFPAQFMTTVQEAVRLLSKDSATVVQNS